MEIHTVNIQGKTPYNNADNSVMNNTASVTPAKTVIRDNGLSSLTEGQFFRGMITDVRGGGLVQILLNNQQTISATLTGNIMMNIGEKVIFQVKENRGDKLIITPTSIGDGTDEAVSRALLGAGLPESDKNIVLVKELMKYHQPIDRETILNLLKETKEFPTAPVSSLVEMNAHGVPVSEENILQLDKYKNFEYKFTDQINQMSEDMVNILKDLSNDTNVSVSMVTDYFENIMDVFTDLPDENQLKGSQAFDVAVGEEILQNENVTDESNQYKDVERFADTVKNMINEATGKEDIKNIASYINDNVTDAADIAEIFSSPDIIRHIKEKIREHFAIKPEVWDEPGKELRVKIDKVYESLSELSEHIEKLTENNPKNESLMEHSRNFNQNLNFMSDLNQLSSFVQIPVQIGEDNANAELFVYNKKRGKVKEGDTLTAFLHFDLENLGATDIHVTLKGNHVNIRFSLDNSNSEKLMNAHMTELTERLEKLGYRAECKTEKVEIVDKSPVKEIFDNDESKIDIKRYLFDIRT